MVGGKMINLSSYQKAIYEELIKLGYNVYDEVSEDAKFPYIVIGDIDFSEGQNNFNDLLDINLNILVWSLWEGKKEVNDILSNIINIFTNLNEKRLEDQSLHNFSFGNSSIKRLDGGIYNGNLALNFSVKEL
jgi:hypothetical protein